MGISWGASALHRAPDGPRCQQVVHQRASASISCMQVPHRHRTISSTIHTWLCPVRGPNGRTSRSLIRYCRVDPWSRCASPRFQPFDATRALTHAYMHACSHTEFEWSPASHQLIAHSYHTFTRNVIELLMIRDMPDAAASSIPWLPNELMFEIFRALFDAYYRQPQ